MKARKIDTNHVRILPFVAEDAQPTSEDVIIDVRYDAQRQQPVIELTVGKGYLINTDAWECLSQFVFALLTATQQEGRDTRNSPRIVMHTVDQAVWDAIHSVGKESGTVLHTVFFRPSGAVQLTAHTVQAASCADALEQRYEVQGRWINSLTQKTVLAVEGKVTFLVAE